MGTQPEPAQPAFEVAQADVDVDPQARLGDRAVRNRQESAAVTWTSSRSRSSWLGPGIRSLKTSSAIGTRPGWATQVPSWPSPASRSLSSRTLAEGQGVGLGVVLDRDLRGHASHRVGAAAVAGLDRKLRVRPHEMRGHRHQRPVGQHELGPVAELLDEAEDVIPAPAVEADDVVAQLVEDLVHLEGRQDRLDQHRGLDRAGGQPELALGRHEDIVPEPGLEMVLELGQVKVRARSLGQQSLGVVEQVQSEVEQGARDGLAVDRDVLLAQVPAAGPDQERGRSAVQPYTSCPRDS